MSCPTLKGNQESLHQAGVIDHIHQQWENDFADVKAAPAPDPRDRTRA